MPVSSLCIENVGPFRNTTFEFDPRVNVLLGPNNSGKSTVLWALGEILVYPFEFPRKLIRSGVRGSYTLRLDDSSDQVFSGTLPILAEVGSADGEQIELQALVERTRNLLDHVERYVELIQKVGYSAFIPALRHSTDFRSAGPSATDTKSSQSTMTLMSEQIETRLSRSSVQLTSSNNQTIDQLFEHPELKKREALPSTDPMLITDRAVMQEIIELDYRGYLTRNESYGRIIELIGEVASDVTDGFISGFAGVDEDRRGFFPKFDTKDGPLPLNTLSQGTQSVVQWIAHFLMGFAQYYGFPEDLKDQSGLLILDEIDAHLHPSWQRRIIPALSNNFPNVQLFCSTHSPLALAGLKKGQVQQLNRDERGLIDVSTNDQNIVGWTADEILRGVLGITDPVDIETLNRLQKINLLQSRSDLTAEETGELDALRDQVGEDLVSGPGSALVRRFADQLRRAREASYTGADQTTPFTPVENEE